MSALHLKAGASVTLLREEPCLITSSLISRCLDAGGGCVWLKLCRGRGARKLHAEAQFVQTAVCGKGRPKNREALLMLMKVSSLPGAMEMGQIDTAKLF